MFESNQQTNLFKAFPLASLLLLPDGHRFTITDVNTAYLKATGVDELELSWPEITCHNVTSPFHAGEVVKLPSVNSSVSWATDKKGNIKNMIT